MAKKDTVGLLVQQKKISTGDLSIKTEKELFLMVDKGFAAFDNDKSEFVATEATPLAMLTPKQFTCVQQLARDCEIAFDYVPKAQKAHMAKLIESGWAMMDKHGSAWKATRRLIEAIGCWQKAKSKVEND